MAASLWVTLHLASIEQAWKLLIVTGAGTGGVLLLRWFWWRVNAWSEVAAMASSFLVAVGFFIARKLGHPVPSTESLLITVITTTIVWISVAYLTPATDRATLVAFYQRVRPAGPGWKDIRAEAGVAAAPDSIAQALLGWAMGCLLVYSALFGTGSFLYGKTSQGIFWVVMFVLSAAGLIRLVPRLWPAPADAT